MFKKKISAAISVLLCVLLLGGCALDSLFEFDRADFTAKEICRFDDMEYVRPDVQAFKDKAQEIEQALTDGTKLEFRRSGEWKEISRYRTGIPEEIIPQPAVVKVNDLYPQACIVKAEYDDGDLELELDNGMELKFDKRLNMIGLDR